MTQEVQREARIYAVTDGELAMLSEWPLFAVFAGVVGGLGLAAGFLCDGLDGVSVVGGAVFLALAISYPLSAFKLVKRIRQESKDRTT